MVKLKNLSGKSVCNVQDHIMQEIQDLSVEISKAILPVISDKCPNIVLSALNFVHTGIIKKLVSDDREQLENAVKNEANGLWKNMQVLIEKMEKGEL